MIEQSEEAIYHIFDDNIDIYEFMGITRTATSAEIRKAYRQHALLYHPDKQRGDETKFTILLKCYEILTNETLRKKYDQLSAAKQQREIDREKLADLTRQFQDELLASEEKVRTNKKRKWGHSIEQLKEDGLMRRRLMEQKLYEKKNVGEAKPVSIDDLPVDDLIQNNFSSFDTVRLKYSYRENLRDLIDKHVIAEIMGIFGEIESVSMLNHDDRYGYALIRYKHDKDATAACNHNYNESATKWDGTKVRKLASLLRHCSVEKVNQDDYTDNPQVNVILEDYKARHVKSVSDKNW
ncbi:DnaJ-like spliceosome component cwf23 [Spathaspora passalidarum NRRL Y-27907]|uniref:DnaJ-like spliceosome component cwf23 n=1 Tax=Spathaspora passalidarum (strain NRRL Y-27907 / 11-Y1) TaxID=619300 RepID=G3AE06_SPAPN|nr:DnaJ-like spliceosome component cwf23 [Spathaspora passalidarum NRRL Y-27907]EGW35540.1 DnaJ-like spliceosome component cwf23 [Spathaspora passalidarum NRRL Y-27907]